MEKTKKCVGVIIYDSVGKIFLMASPKWKAWVVPGGEIKDNETEEEALKREISEELGIEIEKILKVGEKIKEPSEDFIDDNIKFIFIDFFAKAKTTKIKTNEEISKYGWFYPKEALKLNLVDSTRNFIEQFIKKRVNI